MAAYAADLNTAHASRRLRGELREELRAEGSGTSGNNNEEEYVHLDDDDLEDDLNVDDLAYLELPTDEEAAESAAEQRALMASFEAEHRDESARRLMAAERRAAADRLVASQQRVCQSAYLRNMAAAAEARRAAERRQQEEERARGSDVGKGTRAPVPLPSYADADIIKDAQRRRQVHKDRLRRRLGTGNHGGFAPATDGAGGSGARNFSAY
jgi:hypothetical protein